MSEKRDDPQGDKATTVYKVRFQSDGVVRKTYHGSTQNVPQVVTDAYHGSTQDVLGVVRKTYPQETVIQETGKQLDSIQEDTYIASPNVDAAPAPITDLNKWKTDSGKMPAVNLKGQASNVDSDHRHSNSDRDERVSGHDGLNESISTSEQARRRDSAYDATQAATGQLEQTIPTGSGTNSAPTLSTPAQHGDDTSSSSSPVGAVQKPKRTRKPVEPPFTLDAQQQAFWELWCNVWFNAEIKPVLTETAYGHISKLAPYITSDEQLNSLIEYTRKDLADSIGMKRKMVQLGNMVHCYAGWKQAQQPMQSNKLKSGLDAQYGVQAMIARQEAM